MLDLFGMWGMVQRTDTLVVRCKQIPIPYRYFLGETEMRKFAFAAALVILTGSAVNAQTKSTPQAVVPAKVAPAPQAAAKVAPAPQAAAPSKVAPAAQVAAPSKVAPAAQAAPSVPAKSTPQG